MRHGAYPDGRLGTLLGERYRLDRLLGEGASSCVFAACDLRLKREVAVKVFRDSPTDEDTRERRRFVGEGSTLASLDHPHIVAVHDVSAEGPGPAYLVMELSRDGTLEDELRRRGSLPLDESLRIILPLLGALACVHDQGLLHRDIKPANIALARSRPGALRAKLLDFGIAKPHLADSWSDAGLGTPSYMAPEQVREQRLSTGTDVWAMGVVFFRCLSGVLPFPSHTSAAVLLSLVQGRAPHFRDACPGLGAHLAAALDRSLEPDVERRYRDARAFARALAAGCAQDGVAVPRNPEPLGLPDFERWLEAADLESTRRVPPRSTKSGNARVPAWTSYHSVRRALLAGFLGLSLGHPSQKNAAAEARAGSAPRAHSAMPAPAEVPKLATSPAAPPARQASRSSTLRPKPGGRRAMTIPAVESPVAEDFASTAQRAHDPGTRVSTPASNELGLMTTWDIPH